MDIAEAKKYLISQAGDGAVGNPLVQERASISLELGFMEVWGSYPWKVRRKATTLTTTASQASDNLPEDFEMVIWVGAQKSGQKRYIAIREEEWFDLAYPMPTDDSNQLPQDCKIVYNEASPAKSWKIHWWRIPDQAYTIPVAYHRKGDVQFFPKLPTHMIGAVLASALAFFKGNVAERQAYDQMAFQKILQAQVVDKTTSGVFPVFGDDPGWNDFDHGSQGRRDSSYNPLNWGAR